MDLNEFTDRFILENDAYQVFHLPRPVVRMSKDRLVCIKGLYWESTVGNIILTCEVEEIADGAGSMRVRKDGFFNFENLTNMFGHSGSQSIFEELWTLIYPSRNIPDTSTIKTAIKTGHPNINPTMLERFMGRFPMIYPIAFKTPIKIYSMPTMVDLNNSLRLIWTWEVLGLRYYRDSFDCIRIDVCIQLEQGPTNFKLRTDTRQPPFRKGWILRGDSQTGTIWNDLHMDENLERLIECALNQSSVF